LVKYTVHQSCSMAVGELGMPVSGMLAPDTQAEVIRIKTKAGSVILTNGGNMLSDLGKMFYAAIIA
jgi:hypothetical protein